MASASIRTALALVAGAVALARRGGDEDGPASPTEVDHLAPPPAVTVHAPEGWHRLDDVLAGGPGAWPSAAFASYPLVRNAPDSGCNQVPVASLEQLGATDALLWVVEPQGGGGSDADGQIDLPGEPVAGTELEACLPGDADFTVDAAILGSGDGRLLVGVAFGTDADRQLGEIALMLNQVYDGMPPTGDEGCCGQDVGFSDDPSEDSPLVTDILTLFDLPAGATVPRPSPANSYTQAVSGFISSVEYSARCAWYGELIDAVDAGDQARRAAAVAGLRRLAVQMGGGADFTDVIDEVRSTGDSPTARTQLDVNC